MWLEVNKVTKSEMYCFWEQRFEIILNIISNKTQIVKHWSLKNKLNDSDANSKKRQRTGINIWIYLFLNKIVSKSSLLYFICLKNLLQNEL